MKKIFLCLVMAALICTSGCTDYVDGDSTKAPNATLLPIESATVEITSGNMTYPAYFAAPSKEVESNQCPSVVLIHSFNGLEQGYRDMVDMFASEGYVVIAPEWQTFERTPRDEVVKELIQDSIAYLKARDDADPDRLGLSPGSAPVDAIPCFSCPRSKK